jgi:hypothetical protein
VEKYAATGRVAAWKGVLIILQDSGNAQRKWPRNSGIPLSADKEIQLAA